MNKSEKYNRSSLVMFPDYFRGHIPANLHLEELLRDKPIQLSQNINAPRKIYDRLGYIISTIYNKWRFLIENGTILEDEYIRLNSSILQEVARNYKELLEYLVINEVIEVDNFFIVGEKSRGYRLTEEYRVLKYPQTFISYDQSIYRVSTQAKERISRKALKTFPKQKEYFQKLSYDLDCAEQILNSLYLDKANSQDQANRYIHVSRIKKINRSSEHVFTIGKTGRLYTPLSNLKSELRSSLRYNDSDNGFFNEPLCEIDISNSIPCMLATVFNPNSCEKAMVKNKLKTLSARAGSPLSTLSKIESYQNRKDVKLYIKDVMSGALYQKLTELWNKNSDISLSYTREITKKKFLEIINSPSVFSSKEKDALIELYPSVMEFIDNTNGFFVTSNSHKRMKDTILIKRNTPKIALYTQGLEADFLLKGIYKRIQKTLPSVPVFTLHDAIFVPQIALNDVLKNIKDIDNELLGLKLNYKIKQASQACTMEKDIRGTISQLYKKIAA